MTVLAVALGILGIACSIIIARSAFAIARLQSRHCKLEVPTTGPHLDPSARFADRLADRPGSASLDNEPRPWPDRRIPALAGPASRMRDARGDREGLGGDGRRLRVPRRAA